MGIKMFSVCESKRYYDTEWEATIAAAHNKSASMEPYACGSHWHITHKDPDERQGFGGGGRFLRCDNCRQLMRKKDSHKHVCPKERDASEEASQP